MPGNNSGCTLPDPLERMRANTHFETYRRLTRSRTTSPVISAARLSVGGTQARRDTSYKAFDLAARKYRKSYKRLNNRLVFQSLAIRWKRATAHLSSVHEIAMNSDYQRIIGMGIRALPSIFDDLQRGPDLWFWALRAITGENPVPPEHHGKMRLMTQDWIEWGKRHGYTR